MNSLRNSGGYVHSTMGESIESASRKTKVNPSTPSLGYAIAAHSELKAQALLYAGTASSWRSDHELRQLVSCASTMKEFPLKDSSSALM